jgi:hypothetical protein
VANGLSGLLKKLYFDLRMFGLSNLTAELKKPFSFLILQYVPVIGLLNSVVDPDTGASAFLTTGYRILDG